MNNSKIIFIFLKIMIIHKFDTLYLKIQSQKNFVSACTSLVRNSETATYLIFSIFDQKRFTRRKLRGSSIAKKVDNLYVNFKNIQTLTFNQSISYPKSTKKKQLPTANTIKSEPSLFYKQNPVTVNGCTSFRYEKNVCFEQSARVPKKTTNLLKPAVTTLHPFPL